MQPLAFAENGVCKCRAASQGPGTQRDLRDSSRAIASVVMGGSCSIRAEGPAPKHGPRPRPKTKNQKKNDAGRLRPSIWMSARSRCPCHAQGIVTRMGGNPERGSGSGACAASRARAVRRRPESLSTLNQRAQRARPQNALAFLFRVEKKSCACDALCRGRLPSRMTEAQPGRTLPLHRLGVTTRVAIRVRRQIQG
jgi:hypothetical protein